MFAVWGLLSWVGTPCGAQRAPAQFDRPLQLPAGSKARQARAVEGDARTAIDPLHVYVLPELIDLAEEHNPSTRAAWAQARAQAAQLGIARSDLFPPLTAVMMTNTTRDGLLFNQTFVRQTLGYYQPMLEVNYLVLDFGNRSAQIAIARQQLVSANLSYHGGAGRGV